MDSADMNLLLQELLIEKKTKKRRFVISKNLLIADVNQIRTLHYMLKAV